MRETWVKQQIVLGTMGMLLGALLVFPLSPLLAEEMPVPIEIQVPLIMKILTFDRNFDQTFETEVNIGIVYAPGDFASLQAREHLTAWFDQSANKTLKKRPVKYIALAYTTTGEMEEAVTFHQINLLYITPGNAHHLTALLSISQTYQIITATGVPDYVEQGVSIGLGVKEDRKPKIQINLPSSKSEGIDFEAKLLKLAEVIR